MKDPSLPLFRRLYPLSSCGSSERVPAPVVEIPYNGRLETTMIEWILLAVGLYLAIGLVFALVFHRSGLAAMDPGVKDAGWVFRLLVTPGIVALWPVMLGKWRRSLRGEGTAGSAQTPLSPRGLRAAHRWLVTFLALGLPPLVAAGLLLRPPPVGEAALEAPARPLPTDLLRLEAPAGGIALHGLIRGGPGGRRQIELTVEEDLEIPSLALFASRTSDGSEEKAGLPPGSVFVGPVHGPGLLRYELPKRQAGTLVFYSLAQQARVATWEYRIEYRDSARGGS